MDVASAIGRDVIAERVEILAATLGEGFEGALNAGENLEEFRGKFRQKGRRELPLRDRGGALFAESQKENG